MRLQLSILAILLPSIALADGDESPGASGTLRVYADDDHVTVISPSATARADVATHASVAIDAEVDAVSAASVDVVTSASPRTVTERRIQLGLAGTYRAPDHTSITAGATGSHEHDYDAGRARLGIRRELAHRNLTLAVDYVFGRDVATSVMDPTFERDRTSHQLMLGVTQLLDPRTILDVIADGTTALGYHASPYREVPIEHPGSPLPMRVDEKTPRLRTDLAIATRLRRALASHVFGTATYRLYADTWSITSHTLTTEVYWQRRSWLLGVAVRGYAQDGASFYRAHYADDAGIPSLRTRDRTLGPMATLYAGLTVDAPLDADRAWHIVGSLAGLRMWFFDFPAQSDRNALVLHTTVQRRW